jgi:hypothetical protein
LSIADWKAVSLQFLIALAMPTGDWINQQSTIGNPQSSILGTRTP